ncbi:type III secretion system chaperone [Aeromonas tecta]|uniref:type III secretion system chaperone n=2 Tax=Aeromonas tecta TaxID=324617 RepID=UPI0030DD4DCC
MMEDLQYILNDFSENYNLPLLQLNENGCCQLLVEDKLIISFIAHSYPDKLEKNLMLAANIGFLETDVTLRQNTLELLASANYASVATQGHILALAPDDRQIILFGLRSLSQLTLIDLSDWLLSITQIALTWQTKLAIFSAQRTLDNNISSPRDAIRI